MQTPDVSSGSVPTVADGGGAAAAIAAAQPQQPGDGDGQAHPHPGPTVARMLLGAQLRRLREEEGITCEDAGETIRASGSKISRLELGRTGFKIRDVTDILTLYGVHDEADRATLIALARQANVLNSLATEAADPAASTPIMRRWMGGP